MTQTMRDIRLGSIALALAVAIFVIDLRLPLGVAAGVPYVAVVLLGLFSRGIRLTIVLACLGSLLTWLGYELSVPEGEPWMVLANRGLALFAIWSVAGLMTLQFLNLQRSREAERIAQGRSSRSEKSFRGIFDTSPDGIMYGDEPGRPIGANTALLDMFGYTLEELQRKSPAEITPAKWNSIQSGAMNRLLATGEPQEYEKEYIRKDGTVFPVSIRVWLRDPEHFGEGRFLARVQDITERKRAENALLEAKSLAETANQAKSKFLASMSHELRTPLNAVLGYGQMLELYGAEALDEKQREFVSQIIGGGKQLLTLIEMVLDLAKIEVGEIKLNVEPTAPDGLLEDCVSLLAGLAAKANVSLVWQPGDDPAPLVQVDRDRFKQVTLNLLTNAIKYNRPNGKVTLSRRLEPPNMLRILVKDTGVGIAASHHGKIFEPFSRLGQEGGVVEGTGIGLTITRQVVELMGGRVDFESEEGVGSAFWFDLPLSTADNLAGATDASEKNAAQRTNYEALNGTVLYVEDNLSNLKLIEVIAQALPNVRLISVNDGAAGMERALSEVPDLILSDIQMPEMDGYELLRQLRSNPATRDIPVIAISASAMPRDVRKAQRAGFNDFMTKPINVADFIDSLSKFIGSP